MRPYDYQKITKDILKELEHIVGKQFVITDTEKIEPYSHDFIEEEEYSFMPEVVVKPRTASEIADIVKLANKKKFPITPRGCTAELWYPSKG